MKNNARFASVAVLAAALFSTNASAVIFDFIDLTEKAGGLGESSWSSLTAADHADLNHFGISITGHATDDAPNTIGGPPDLAQFAYLDWNNAGLGVCKDADGAPSGNNSGSSANSCLPSSDDNVTDNEYLEFVFAEDVVVEDLRFNNNHDGGFMSGDQITINGVDLSVAFMEIGNYISLVGFAPINLLAGDVLTVAHKNQQFYVSGMTVSSVPVPAAVWLFGTALIGFVGLGRRTSVS